MANRDIAFGDTPHSVLGILLFAKTEEKIQRDNVYKMSSNKISVKTLDFNLPFENIRAQLDAIAHFGEDKKIS